MGHVEQTAVLPEAFLVRTTNAQVVHISGCRDDQTSTDAFIEGENVGAMSHALLSSFEPGITYAALLHKMRESMAARKYKQIPLLNSGYEMDLATEVFNM